MFYFIFFLPPDLQGPLADCRKILPHGRKCVRFYNLSPKISGLDRDIDEEKTAFSTTIYPMSNAKKFSELGFTNNKV